MLGTVTEPPRATVVPLTVIVSLTRAAFGIEEKMFSEPDIVQFSKVLFETVCVCVR